MKTEGPPERFRQLANQPMELLPILVGGDDHAWRRGHAFVLTARKFDAVHGSLLPAMEPAQVVLLLRQHAEDEREELAPRCPPKPTNMLDQMQERILGQIL